MICRSCYTCRCICGEEDNLHILVHCYLESPPSPRSFFFFFPVFPLEFYLGRPGDREGLHLKEDIAPLGSEAWLVLAMEGLVWQWELDPGVLELLDRWLVALAGCDLLHLHNLD